MEKIQAILQKVSKWADRREDIIAAALVGSWARGTANKNSDIDIMLLVTEPDIFRDDRGWLSEIDWKKLGCDLENWQDREYGVVRSRHLYFRDKTEVELSFGLPSWASIDPIDPGTLKVVRDGCCILYDPDNLISKLLDFIQ